MKKTLWLVSIIYALILFGSTLNAAPIRGQGPFDITGTISESAWVPEEFRKGRPGWSGSLRHDRVVPSHFVVKLVKYSGVPAESAVRITRYINYKAYGEGNPSGMPPFIILKINSKESKFLKKGMKIRVTGYTVRGDEGGTWTSNTGVSIQ
jgi:hypothetical protein